MSEMTSGTSDAAATAAQLQGLSDTLTARFPKPYSGGRLEVVQRSLAVAAEHIAHLFDEEAREEHPERKDQVAAHFISQGRTLSEAQKMAESGMR
jgi:hypothetical protein